jgi:hypothetical protein
VYRPLGRALREGRAHGRTSSLRAAGLLRDAFESPTDYGQIDESAGEHEPSYFSEKLRNSTQMEKLCYLGLNLDLVLSRVPSASSPGRGRQHLVSLPSQPGAAVPAAHVLERTGQILQLRPALGRFPELGATQPVRRSAAKELHRRVLRIPELLSRHGLPAGVRQPRGWRRHRPPDRPARGFQSGSGHAGRGRPARRCPGNSGGVGGATQFPATGVPVAVAPPDHTIVDTNGDDFELVMLDASASYDPEGSISTYTWTLGGKP